MATCKGCGRTIEWGVTEGGQKIPLDRSAPVYGILELPDGTIQVKRLTLAAVSHFATCRAADQFSGRNRKGPAAPAPAPGEVHP